MPFLRIRFSSNEDGSEIFSVRSWRGEPAYRARIVNRSGTLAAYFTLPLSLVNFPRFEEKPPVLLIPK